MSSEDRRQIVLDDDHHALAETIAAKLEERGFQPRDRRRKGASLAIRFSLRMTAALLGLPVPSDPGDGLMDPGPRPQGR